MLLAGEPRMFWYLASRPPSACGNTLGTLVNSHARIALSDDTILRIHDRQAAFQHLGHLNWIHEPREF